MNVSIKTDKYGIQLCTDKEGVDNALELQDVDEVRKIQYACEEFIRSDKTGLHYKLNGDYCFGNINLSKSASALSKWLHERNEEAIIVHMAKVDLPNLIRMRDAINKAIEKVNK
jgi:hypothetical protein